MLRNLRWLVFLLLAGAAMLRADTVTVTGTITQSTQDGTGPAVSNPGLNNILDKDSFSVTFGFDGAITAPGTYNSLTGTSLIFADGAITESSFSSESLTIGESGGFDQFSFVGCLTTGSACDQFNQLDLIFQIAAPGINSPGTATQDQPLLSPSFELFEDDGVTDIHGELANYSYTGVTAPTPEPGTLALLGSGIAGIWLRRRYHPQ
ncbi:MAG TPA: PEP-CTERM sorting domain-containing protein [Terriglobales bacterium]|nr:PEP-CTERM sorting domain-containing protein [Terriglobales bacterium]